MAARGSIISSVKAVSGASRTNPSGQAMGANPFIGQMSPLVGQLDTGRDTGNWTNAYRQTLPRPQADFTNGAFGPFSPILPVPVDAPAEGTEFAEPRLFQYEVGWNLPVGTPGTEAIKMATFGTLQTLADLYSVARACIDLRKNEIIGLEWDIIPTADARRDMRGNHKAVRDFAQRRAEAIKFFRSPDPDYFSWGTFMGALLEEVFVFDALSLVFRNKWSRNSKRGLLGSRLDSLSLINGPTVRPLLGMHGERPRPPAPAYQQYLYGVPRTDMMSIITDRDIEVGGLTGAEMNTYRVDQLLYLPMTPRRWTPYGFPPIERALLPVLTGLYRQKYQNDYFSEGTVPAVYISPGGANTNMTPNQIRELQDALNAIAGDPAWKHRIIVLPADSRVDPQRPHPLADQFDEVVMSQVLMEFEIQPPELGLVPKVSAALSAGAARQMSHAGQAVQERKSTKQILKNLTDIFDYILQSVCKQDDMRFVFEGMESTEDEETKTKTLVTQVSAGFRSIDEAREELNLQPWGLHETSEPGWATPGAGFVPLTEATMARATGYAEGPVFNDGEQVDSNTMLETGMSGSEGDVSSKPSSKPSPHATPVKPTDQARPSVPAAPKPTAPRKSPPGAPLGGGVAAGAKKPPAVGTTSRKKPGNQARQTIDAGGSGVSAVGRKPSTKAVYLDPTASHARIQEMEAMIRMTLKKGRSLMDWEPRHLDVDTMMALSYLQKAGLPLEEAVTVVKRRRVVDINGQERWIANMRYEDIVPAGGGGPYQRPHDVDDIWQNKDDTRSEPIAHTSSVPDDGDDARFAGTRGVSPANQGLSYGPAHDMWPRGGHGTDQSPVSMVPGVSARKGDASSTAYAQMLENFPPRAIEWMRDATWVGPIEVPQDEIDFDHFNSWATAHEMGHVRHFEDKIRAGELPNPSIGVRVPGHNRVRLVDGHHRATAYRKLNKPALMYVGTVPNGDDRWEETHSYQVHHGNDPANKSASLVPKASVNYRPSDDMSIRCGTCSMFVAPSSCTLVAGMIKPDDVCDRWAPAVSASGSIKAACVVVKAADTGRVLMLQRSLRDPDPSAGLWEFPGGHLEPGESPLQGARREWQEETGCSFPDGKLLGNWVSGDGVFQGFTYVIPEESDVEIFGDRDDIDNPDDPDGDIVEAIAWWDPSTLRDNPAVRSECLRDMDRIMAAMEEHA